MPDLITFGETPLRFSPPGNERLESADETTVNADGTASNTAVAANELGAETLWLSKLPDTPLGRRVETQLEEQGIETHIAWDESGELRQGLLFREAGAEPRKTRHLHDRGNTAAATAEPGDFPMEQVQDSEIIFAGLGTAVLSEEAATTTGALLRAAGGSGAMTAVSLDYSDDLAPQQTYQGVFDTLSEDVDVLFASEKDVREALGRSGRPRELANTIAADYDLEIIVITRAERGAVALRNSPGTNIIHERETIPSEDVDRTGQRGAFIGSFLEQLIDGADTARALTYGVAGATLARTIPGPFLTTTSAELDPIADEVVEASQ